MLRTLTILINAAFLLFCSFARAAEVPIPATPSRWVTDTAGFLSAETQQTLDKRLEQYEKKSGRKVAVWIGTTAGDAALETWASSAIQAWKVREKAFADGVVLFILTQDRAIDIEVAPGLDKQLPDEFVGRVIFDQMAPRLDKGDADGAVTAGMEALLTKLDTPLPEAVPNQAVPPIPQTTEDSTKTPANPESTTEPTSTFRTPSILMLVALGALVLLSTVATAAIGWPRGGKKRS
jgi:uncharacterized protein